MCSIYGPLGHPEVGGDLPCLREDLHFQFICLFFSTSIHTYEGTEAVSASFSYVEEMKHVGFAIWPPRGSPLCRRAVFSRPGDT